MHRAPRRPRSAFAVAMTVAVIAEAALVGWPAAASAASILDTVTAAVASPRVFYPNGDGVNDATTLHFELSRPATVTVSVTDFAGRSIRTLQPATAQAAGGFDVAWNGRTVAGAPVQDAGYRFRLTETNELGTFSVDRPVTKARNAIFPANPGAITVAIDAGHGGPDPGAIRPPLAEKVANFDIAMRLRAMLLGAGVNVVMTRVSDSRVNVRNVDWTRDGKVGYRDELASRIEVANAARADVFLALHNNGTPPGVGGTETWYDPSRTFAASNKWLARLVQQGLMSNLRTLRTSAWAPKDRGVKALDFYVLRGYKAGFCERPSQMPAILGESLAMGSRYEVRLLRNGAARQTIAEGYYDALVRFFAARPWGARYTLVTSPGTSLAEGAPGDARVRVTNTSPRAWPAGAMTLTMSAVPAVAWYDGTNAAGARLAAVPLTAALGPGESMELDVPFTAPSYASVASRGGKTILKFDLLAGSARLASAGVPPMQIWLGIDPVITPPPPPTPTPSATPEPTASPDASPTP